MISQWVDQPTTEDLHDDTPLILVAAAVGAVLSLLIDAIAHTPSLGVHPFGRTLLPIAVIVSFAVALTTYRGLLDDGHRLESLAVAIGLAYAAFLISSVTSLLLDDFFIGLHMDAWAIHTLTGVYAGAIAHLIVEITRHITLKGLFQLLVVVLGSGFLVSMISVGSPDWWRDSLSWMGYDGNSGFVFNGTLIIGGIVLGVYGAGVIRLLQANKAHAHATQLIPYLVGMAVGTVCIGLFPMRVSPISQVLHDVSAFIALGGFVGFALILARQDDLYSAKFRRRCTGGVLIILVMGGLYLLQIANYTFSELAIIAVIAYLLGRLNREMRVIHAMTVTAPRNVTAEILVQSQQQMEIDEQ